MGKPTLAELERRVISKLKEIHTHAFSDLSNTDLVSTLATVRGRHHARRSAVRSTSIDPLERSPTPDMRFAHVLAHIDASDGPTREAWRNLVDAVLVREERGMAESDLTRRNTVPEPASLNVAASASRQPRSVPPPSLGNQSRSMPQGRQLNRPSSPSLSSADSQIDSAPSALPPFPSGSSDTSVAPSISATVPQTYFVTTAGHSTDFTRRSLFDDDELPDEESRDQPSAGAGLGFPFFNAMEAARDAAEIRLGVASASSSASNSAMDLGADAATAMPPPGTASGPPMVIDTTSSVASSEVDHSSRWLAEWDGHLANSSQTPPAYGIFRSLSAFPALPNPRSRRARDDDESFDRYNDENDDDDYSWLRSSGPNAVRVHAARRRVEPRIAESNVHALENRRVPQPTETFPLVRPSPRDSRRDGIVWEDSDSGSDSNDLMNDLINTFNFDHSLFPSVQSGTRGVAVAALTRNPAAVASTDESEEEQRHLLDIHGFYRVQSHRMRRQAALARGEISASNANDLVLFQ